MASAEPVAPLAARLTFNAAELAAALGVDERTVWRKAASDELPPSVRVGRRRLWSKTAVDAWLAAGCPARRR